MDTFKIVCLVLVFGLSLMNTNAQQKIQFSGGKIKQKNICDNPECEPGNSWGGLVLRFADSPYNVEVTENISEKTAALQLLGRSFENGELLLTSLKSCAETGSASPFSTDDITLLSTTSGTTFTYVTDKNFELTVGGKTEINNQILNSTTDKAKAQRIINKLQAEYKIIRNKKLIVTGNYKAWGLKQDVFDTINTSNPKFSNCSNYLRNNNHQIITAVGLVNLNVSAQGGSIDSFVNEIQSKLNAEGLDIDITLALKIQVAKLFGRETLNNYQIPFIRHRLL